MPILKLHGVPPYDGDYEVPANLTNGELHRIWQVCGIPAGELGDAVEKGNIGAMVALAVVTLERNGEKVDPQILWDATTEIFDSEADAEEDEDRPPAIATTGGEKNKAAGVANEQSQTPPSGSNGAADGDDSQTIPLGTGLPGSVTPADFDPVTSAN